MPESFFLVKLQAEACNFIKERDSGAVVFLCAKVLRTLYLQNISGRILTLNYMKIFRFRACNMFLPGSTLKTAINSNAKLL